jgi:hypothetical protein
LHRAVANPRLRFSCLPLTTEAKPNGFALPAAISVARAKRNLSSPNVLQRAQKKCPEQNLLNRELYNVSLASAESSGAKH